MESPHAADLELAARCAAGDPAAWERFVLEYRPVLYRAADALSPQGGAREIADSLYAQKKFDQAILQYDIVLQKYPDSDTNRAALLKKGLAQAELNQPQAKDTLNEVVKKYPKTSEAEAATAKLKELQAPAQRGRTPAR